MAAGRLWYPDAVFLKPLACLAGVSPGSSFPGLLLAHPTVGELSYPPG